MIQGPGKERKQMTGNKKESSQHRAMWQSACRSIQWRHLGKEQVAMENLSGLSKQPYRVCVKTLLTNLV